MIGMITSPDVVGTRQTWLRHPVQAGVWFIARHLAATIDAMLALVVLALSLNFVEWLRWLN